MMRFLSRFLPYRAHDCARCTRLRADLSLAVELTRRLSALSRDYSDIEAAKSFLEDMRRRGIE